MDYITNEPQQGQEQPFTWTGKHPEHGTFTYNGGNLSIENGKSGWEQASISRTAVSEPEQPDGSVWSHDTYAIQIPSGYANRVIGGHGQSPAMEISFSELPTQIKPGDKPVDRAEQGIIGGIDMPRNADPIPLTIKKVGEEKPQDLTLGDLHSGRTDVEPVIHALRAARRYVAEATGSLTSPSYSNREPGAVSCPDNVNIEFLQMGKVMQNRINYTLAYTDPSNFLAGPLRQVAAPNLVGVARG